MVKKGIKNINKISKSHFLQKIFFKLHSFIDLREYYSGKENIKAIHAEYHLISPFV